MLPILAEMSTSAAGENFENLRLFVEFWALSSNPAKKLSGHIPLSPSGITGLYGVSTSWGNVNLQVNRGAHCTVNGDKLWLYSSANLTFWENGAMHGLWSHTVNEGTTVHWSLINLLRRDYLISIAKVLSIFYIIINILTFCHSCA